MHIILKFDSDTISDSSFIHLFPNI